MLTHKDERPAKCPIPGCRYNTRGFSRRHDRNRHVLIHFEGILSCNICPGVGTATEKRFHRVDMFKKHIANFHKMKASTFEDHAAPSTHPKRARGCPLGTVDVDIRCSICQQSFSSARHLYDHLDGCVLDVVERVSDGSLCVV